MLENTIDASSFWQAAFEQTAAQDSRWCDSAAEEAFWQAYAPAYDERSPLAQHADVLVADVRALLCPDDRLLEIGPGTGAFTKRLAGYVDELVGVEPSPSMRAALWQGWDSDAAKRPSLWPYRWEETPVCSVDVIFGCNAFYRMQDIAAALTKMHRCATRHVVLAQSIGEPYAAPLRVQYDGHECHRERAYALCDVLDEMGIAYRLRRYRLERTPGAWGRYRTY